MKLIIFSIIGVLALTASYFFYGLTAVSGDIEIYSVSVKVGEGFRDIAANLENQKIVISATSFKMYALFTGAAHRLKPGEYLLSPSWSTPKIIQKLVEGPVEDVKVVIIEGETVKDINKKLQFLGILKGKESLSEKMEGRLFPDTYRFFPNSSVEDIVAKFSNNFKKKVSSVNSQTLIMASLIEKEVPFYGDRFLVSGILWKRFKIGMPLQVDATICYAKFRSSVGCYPLSKEDFQINSRYNTYKYNGLPPAPIGNPGFNAIQAALNPQTSDYWYYLSDPKTKRTVFARTLDEQNDNRVRYLTRD